MGAKTYSPSFVFSSRRATGFLSTRRHLRPISPFQFLSTDLPLRFLRVPHAFGPVEHSPLFLPRLVVRSLFFLFFFTPGLVLSLEFPVIVPPIFLLSTLIFAFFYDFPAPGATIVRLFPLFQKGLRLRMKPTAFAPP